MSKTYRHNDSKNDHNKQNHRKQKNQKQKSVDMDEDDFIFMVSADGAEIENDEEFHVQK